MQGIAQLPADRDIEHRQVRAGPPPPAIQEPMEKPLARAAEARCLGARQVIADPAVLLEHGDQQQDAEVALRSTVVRRGLAVAVEVPLVSRRTCSAQRSSVCRQAETYPAPGYRGAPWHRADSPAPREHGPSPPSVGKQAASSLERNPAGDGPPPSRPAMKKSCLFMLSTAAHRLCRSTGRGRLLSHPPDILRLLCCLLFTTSSCCPAPVLIPTQRRNGRHGQSNRYLSLPSVRFRFLMLDSLPTACSHGGVDGQESRCRRGRSPSRRSRARQDLRAATTKGSAPFSP